MSIKEDFESLLDKLQVERDEINLKLHLASKMFLRFLKQLS